MGPDGVISNRMVRVCSLNEEVKQSEILHCEYRGSRLDNARYRRWLRRRPSYQCPDLVDLNFGPFAMKPTMAAVVT